jgi:hypothetical protein
MSNVRVLQGTAGTETTESPLAELLSRSMNFSPDAWHVMQERDEAMIRDQVLHGYASRDFIYSFQIQGKAVTGISVVGARELASKYGGIKARIVATVEKRGGLFIFRTFAPLTIDTRQLHELADDDDFYECVMEISDIKSGNSIEVRKKEMRTERTKEGKTYQRPHYDVIAESKAYRNGVLAILPQSVISEFEAKCLKAGNVSNEKTIDQLRDGCMAYATRAGISLDRRVLASLAYSELIGLSQASKVEGGFLPAAQALGLVVEKEQSPADTPPPRRGRPVGSTNKPKTDEPKTENQAPPVDTQTGEVGTLSFSFAVVADEINKAQTEDALNLAADLIRYAPNPEQQAELAQLYQSAKARITDDVPY